MIFPKYFLGVIINGNINVFSGSFVLFGYKNEYLFIYSRNSIFRYKIGLYKTSLHFLSFFVSLHNFTFYPYCIQLYIWFSMFAYIACLYQRTMYLYQFCLSHCFSVFLHITNFPVFIRNSCTKVGIYLWFQWRFWFYKNYFRPC